MTFADVLCLLVALGALGVLGAFLVAAGRAQLPAAQAWQVLAKLHEGQDDRVHTAIARLTAPAASPSAKAQVEELERQARAQGFTLQQPSGSTPRGPARENPIPPAPEPPTLDLPAGFIE